MAIQFMYSELLNGVSERMRNDPESRIISDGMLFLITNESNTSNYPELTFEIADQESLDAYSEQLNGLI
jgi:hypothetical protein